MWRRIHLLPVLVIAIVLAALAIVGLRDTDPVYQGKKLSQWLEELDSIKTERQAEEAIRHIGPKAVPMLNGMLRKRDSKLKKLWADVVGHPIHDTPAMVVNERAEKACRVLGPLAKGTIPALVDLLHHSKDGCGPAFTLASIGPKALPALIDALSDHNAQVRRCAAAALGDMSTNAAAAIPALVRTLQDTNTDVRRAVLASLADLKAKPELVVPGLVEILADTNKNARISALACLGSLGRSAQDAAPVVSKFVHHEDRAVRIYAIQALNRISPETATQLKVNPENLIEQLEKGSDEEKRNGLAVLYLLNDGTDMFITAFARRLQDPNPDIRRSAIMRLAATPTNFAPVITALQGALTDEESEVRLAATNGLKIVFREMNKQTNTTLGTTVKTH